MLAEHLGLLIQSDPEVPAYRPEDDVSLEMPAFKYVHGERHW